MYHFINNTIPVLKNQLPIQDSYLYVLYHLRNYISNGLKHNYTSTFKVIIKQLLACCIYIRELIQRIRITASDIIKFFIFRSSVSCFINITE
jgi:hypothetical protein